MPQNKLDIALWDTLCPFANGWSCNPALAFQYQPCQALPLGLVKYHLRLIWFMCVKCTIDATGAFSLAYKNLLFLRKSEPDRLELTESNEF